MIQESSGGFNTLYFDLSEGVLLIGTEAKDYHLEAGGNPADVAPLPQVLLDDSFVIPADRYPKTSFSDWNREDDITYAHFLHQIAVESGQRITKDIITKAGYLGIGPRIKHFTGAARYGNLSNFYTEAGLHDTHQVGRFRHWSRADYVAYIKNIAAEIGGRPSQDILWARQQSGVDTGPSPYDIRQAIGSTNLLLELAGFPNIHSWDEQDFIDWGVKFMLANNGILPTASRVQKLSLLKKGPSARVIQNRFVLFSTYKERVAEAYARECAFRQARSAAFIEEILSGIGNDLFPSDLFENAPSVEAEIQILSKFKVVEKLLGDLTDSQKVELARKPPQNFIAGIQNYRPTLSAGEIEEVALRLDVTDEIWPMDDYLTDLRL